jgi:hypothetical protein
MQTQKLLELYAKYIWPIHRLFVKKQKRCKKCILSTKSTQFNSDTCIECGTTIKPSVGGIHNFEEFDNKVLSLKTDGKYQAIFLLSGGKDSAYSAYTIRTHYPDLRMLGVFVDNGFTSDYVYENLKHTTDKLKMDYIIINSFKPEFKKNIREAIISILPHRTAYDTIDYADGSLIHKIGMDIASYMNIPIIFSGISYTQLTYIDNEEGEKFIDGKILFPLAIWRISESTIRSLVVLHDLIKLGNESPLVTNSKLIIPMAAIDMKRQGFSSFEKEFAKLVREGKAKRKTWLYIFELLDYITKIGILDKMANKVLKELNLSMDDIKC